MAENQVCTPGNSGDTFHLDTKNFNELITSSRDLAEKMRDLKFDLEGYKNSLVRDWIGDGSNTFQKKFNVLMQQLTDLKDDLYEISDKIASDYEQYMQWDTNAAKTQDGTSNRY